MVQASSLLINVFSKLCILCTFGFSFFNTGYCSTIVQALDSEYAVIRSHAQSENFFARDDDFENRLQDFLKVKNYALHGLRGPNARSSADDIVDSLMNWYYSESLKILKRKQVLSKVLQDFRECCQYYTQDSDANQNILNLLAPFCAVQKVLGK